MIKKGLTNRECMILSALRYSLYRRSYMPSVCRREIRREVEEGNLSQRAISQAIHEINKIKKDSDKGMIDDWYQEAKWLDLRDWLREKLTDEKQIQWLKQVGNES